MEDRRLNDESVLEYNNELKGSRRCRFGYAIQLQKNRVDIIHLTIITLVSREFINPRLAVSLNRSVMFLNKSVGCSLCRYSVISLSHDAHFSSSSASAHLAMLHALFDVAGAASGSIASLPQPGLAINSIR